MHSDIKPDKILIHNNVPVLADFGLTTRQGTGSTLVGTQLTYPAVYTPCSTIDLAQPNVHVNRDWFAFTVVVYEMYLNQEINSESWWASDKVIKIDRTYGIKASEHYEAETRLFPYMTPVSAGVPKAVVVGHINRPRRSIVRTVAIPWMICGIHTSKKARCAGTQRTNVKMTEHDLNHTCGWEEECVRMHPRHVPIGKPRKRRNGDRCSSTRHHHHLGQRPHRSQHFGTWRRMDHTVRY